jgi:DNA polymerase III subunit delta'
MGFDSFLGNPAAVRTVREMLRAGRVPGALLFTGPEGVGKKTLALMLAQAAVCERLPDDFCGECARCRRAGEMIAMEEEDLARRREMKESGRRVEGLVYFDLQLIAPITRYILSEQIRVLRQVAYTRPFELPRRFFIIDQAQDIHWQAVDLLLKVMEEPPGTTTFILVCPNAGELRSTIRSRCQRLTFMPVDETLIERLLAERTRAPQPQQKLVARLSAGSVGRALAFDLPGCLARRELWLAFFQSVSGGLRDRARGPDWQGLFDATRKLAADRESFEDVLNMGAELLRDLLLVLESGDRAVVSHFDLLPRLKTWATALGFEGIVALKEGLDEARRLQIRNVNQQLSLDALAIGMLSRGHARPPGAGRP